jgi:LacI family transcriptional regulator
MPANATVSVPTPVLGDGRGGGDSKQVRQIVCWVDRSSDYGKDIAMGVNQYSQSIHGWNVLHVSPDSTPLERWLEQHRCDGMILQDSRPASAALLQRHGIVAVNVSAKVPNPALPTVVSDNYAAGQMAADHLIACGLRQFAAIGLGVMGGLQFSDLRVNGFRDRLRQQNFQLIEPMGLNTASSWVMAAQQLDFDSPHLGWLLQLPKPIGLLAASHVIAPAVVRLCQRARLVLPRDVALVCVDDDAVMCSSVTPSITSVGLNGLVVGFEAAQLLDTLLAGAPTPTAPRLVPPGHLNPRGSSAASPMTDQRLVRALAYIEQHCGRTVYVEDIARHLGLSRSALQHAFVAQLGYTLVDAINQARIKKAKHLLRSTTAPMPQVASRCGFQRPQYFARVFRTHTGLTPTQYRRQSTAGAERAATQ